MLIVAVLPVRHTRAVEIPAGLPRPRNQTSFELLPVALLIRLAVVTHRVINFVDVLVPARNVTHDPQLHFVQLLCLIVI